MHQYPISSASGITMSASALCKETPNSIISSSAGSTMTAATAAAIAAASTSTTNATHTTSDRNYCF